MIYAVLGGNQGSKRWAPRGGVAYFRKMVNDNHDNTHHKFNKAVNMTAAQLEKWLNSDESKNVGQKSEGHESTGHRSGRHIIRILHTKEDDLSDADYAHMRKVIGYIARHSKQRPSGDITDTPWRYSLMNWGHDPQD